MAPKVFEPSFATGEWLQDAPLPVEGVHPVLHEREQRILVSWSIPCRGLSLLSFLEYGSGSARVYWESERLELAFAGIGIAASIEGEGTSRFEHVAARARGLFESALHLHDGAPSTVGPKLFGGFAFWSGHTASGIWSAFPAARFLLPRYLLTQVAGDSWLTVTRYTKAHEDMGQVIRQLRQESRRLVRALRPGSNEPPESGGSDTPRELVIEEMVERAAWEGAVAEVVQRIQRGELDKAVLARPKRVRAAQPIEPVPVLQRLQKQYPDCYRFLIEPVLGHSWYGASPELLAGVNGAGLHTAALAGSRPRGRTQEEDAALGHDLLTSVKERHEHALVVDALAQQLQPLVSELAIPDEPMLRRLGTIQHLQTPISGRLCGRTGILPLVKALHPTPALGGWPSEPALQLIKSLEPFARGWYAAPIGWMDARGDGLFAVAIRSAVSAGREAWLFAGAGIVDESEPEREWEESDLKFTPMLDALRGGQRG